MRRIITFLLCGVLFLSLTSCGTQESNSMVPGNSSDYDLDLGAKDEPTNDGASDSTQTPQEHSMPKLGLNPVNVYTMDETAVLEDFKCELSNLTLIKSKTLPQGVAQKEIMYFSSLGETTNKDGNLTSTHSYAFLTLEIKNLEQTSREIHLNALGSFAIMDESLTLSISFEEARYRSGDADIESKSYFAQEFEAGEKRSFTIGYIFNDDMINADNLYFVLGSSSLGASADSDSIKAYKIVIN